MPETKDFHLGDVLTITTGRLLSTRHMEGVYDILNWMSDDELMTHQLPRVSEEAKPFLLASHPELASVEVPEITSQESLEDFLATLYPTLGEHLAVHRMPADAHERKNALVEMAEMMRPDQEILVVEVQGSASA